AGVTPRMPHGRAPTWRLSCRAHLLAVALVVTAAAHMTAAICEGALVGASRSRCSPQALESAFPEATGRMACKAGVGQSSWRCRQPAGPRSRPELPRERTGDPHVGFALPFHGQSPLLVGRVALSARRDPCLRQSAPPFLPQPSTPADLTERPSSRAPTPSGLRCPSESETYRPPLREMYVRPLFMPLRVTAEVCPSCRPGNWEAQKCRSTCGVTTSGQSGRCTLGAR